MLLLIRVSVYQVVAERGGQFSGVGQWRLAETGARSDSLYLFLYLWKSQHDNKNISTNLQQGKDI